MPRTTSARPELVGAIVGGKPRISLELASPEQLLANVLVDTGFSGALGVPSGTFAEWGRTDRIISSVETADGTIHDCPSIEVDVLWLGSARTVRVIELGRDRVVGMLLLTGTQITLESVGVRIAAVPEGAESITIQ